MVSFDLEPCVTRTVASFGYGYPCGDGRMAVWPSILSRFATSARLGMIVFANMRIEKGATASRMHRPFETRLHRRVAHVNKITI